MNPPQKTFEVIISDGNVRIIDGWSTSFGAQRMFLALCHAVLAQRVELMKSVLLNGEDDPEHRLPFEMQMKTDSYASFTSEFVTITEHQLGGGWCGSGFEWEIKGDKALEIVKIAARHLRVKVKVLS